MAEAKDLVGANRTWFADVRTPARRMAVATHPAEGVVVVSHWHGDECVSTFRLPVADASRLIASLASGMAAAITNGNPSPTPPPARGWKRLADRLRLRRPSATDPPPLRAVQ
jgi:hypothetical protein